MKLRLKHLKTIKNPNPDAVFHNIKEAEIEIISVHEDGEEIVLGTVDNVLWASVDKDRNVTFTMKERDARS